MKMVFSTLAKTKTEDIHGREHSNDVVSRIALDVYRSWQLSIQPLSSTQHQVHCLGVLL